MGSHSSSPLRYPGGKQRLTPFLTEILIANNLIGGHYVEPYAGGAGAALELLLRGKVSSIHLNDSSYAIYAFQRKQRSGLKPIVSGQPANKRLGIGPAIDFGAEIAEFVGERAFVDLGPPGFRAAVAAV